MTTNAEIGERLRAERQRLGLTQPQIASTAGVSKTSQVNYEAGTRAPDTAYLQAVSTLGVDVAFVVTGRRAGEQPSADLVAITRLDVRASAGSGSVNEPAAEYRVSALCVSRAWLQERRLSAASLCAIQVRGNSMQGVLSDGDLVIVDQADKVPRSGFVYVIRNSEELLVKYCEQLPGGVLRISSANPAFQPYDVDLTKVQDVSIIGRVVASMHDW